MIGQVSPKSPSQRPWIRDSCDPIQSSVLIAALGVSRDKPVIVTRFIGLTSLIHSTVAFLSAFGLEALLFSNGLWTRVPVGVILVMILMLISWCIWTTLEAKTDFSLLSSVHTLKDRLVDFTRGARGNASEPGSDVGDAGDDDGQGKIRRLSRSGTLKEAFGRLRPRRPRASTSATLVNPTGVIGFVPGVTIVEMDKIKKNDSGSAV